MKNSCKWPSLALVVRGSEKYRPEDFLSREGSQAEQEDLHSEDTKREGGSGRQHNVVLSVERIL